ncbi:hypothetical protein NDU88_002949 [Pleurodeles waltl]|uniref:Uncharacterized protein n=1 Tax=Pleurodeles waltl TaxID=8319 RepID=A0AAV7WT88_PLEWA|nr:hypothetical protein NDU88_002949 [Pleurodeles waltl]
MGQYTKSQRLIADCGPWGTVRGHPDTATLLTAINLLRDMLDAKIEVVGSDVTLLIQDLRIAVEQITKAETRVSGVKISVHILQHKVQSLEGITKKLALLVEDAEERACRDNLRFVDFSEGCEGNVATRGSETAVGEGCYSLRR